MLVNSLADHHQFHVFQGLGFRIPSRREALLREVKYSITDGCPIADDDHLLDSMLQLPDITIPRMLLQFLLGTFGKSKRTFVVLLGKAFDEEFRKRDDVFLAFPQRRYFEMNGIDAVEQIFAELALCHPLVQIGISSTYQADIHRNGFIASHPHHATALEYGEQLRLQVIRQIAYLVKENRSFMGSLELARTVGMRIGKGSFLMPEQFAFEKRLRYGTHIHRHHIPTETLGEAMNLPCQHFLTRPVLSRDEHIGIRFGYLLHQGAEFTHRCAGPPIHGRRLAFFLLLAPFGGLVASIQQSLDEFGIVPWLHYEVRCSLLDAPYSQVDISIGCEEYHR